MCHWTPWTYYKMYSCGLYNLATIIQKHLQNNQLSAHF